MTEERQQLIDQLIAHEGMRLRPYVDTVGKITIGCGRNLTDVGLSNDEALELLDHDIDDAILDLATFDWFPSLDLVRQRAVIDLRFNLGHEGFRTFKAFIAAMARKSYKVAGLELQTSKWAHQVQPTRVMRLRAMVETGED